MIVRNPGYYSDPKRAGMEPHVCQCNDPERAGTEPRPYKSQVWVAVITASVFR